MRLAESVVLRGARWPPDGGSGAGSAATLSAAAAALDAALVSEHVHCVRHRCVAPLPLPVPLPLPAALLGALSRHGYMPGAGAGNSCVKLCPTLTKLVATCEFARGPLQNAEVGLGRAGRTAAGSALLGAWGYGVAEVAECVERLRALQERYNPDGDEEDL